MSLLTAFKRSLFSCIRLMTNRVILISLLFWIRLINARFACLSSNHIVHVLLAMKNARQIISFKVITRTIWQQMTFEMRNSNDVADDGIVTHNKRRHQKQQQQRRVTAKIYRKKEREKKKRCQSEWTAIFVRWEVKEKITFDKHERVRVDPNFCWRDKLKMSFHKFNIYYFRIFHIIFLCLLVRSLYWRCVVNWHKIVRALNLWSVAQVLPSSSRSSTSIAVHEHTSRK